MKGSLLKNHRFPSLHNLGSSDPRKRDQAALDLLDFAETSVEILFREIARPENRNHRGTLVFALQVFRCEGKFNELFDLALHANYEVQCHALSILRDQSFEVTTTQLHKAKRALNALRERKNLPEKQAELLRKELQTALVLLC